MLGPGDESEVLGLLQALDFLYDRCREWESDEEDFRPALRSFLKATRLWNSLGSEPEGSFDRLAKILAPNPDIEHRRKLRWLRTGILDNAVEFSSFVDLRPDFSTDRSEVRGLVPVAILRVKTESDMEKDRSHTFQLTPDGVHKLHKALDDIEKKFAAIGANPELGRLIRDDNKESGEDNNG